MMNVAPKVSVCIPTYNYGQYLRETIKSVLSQTFSDFELLVIDNCSTDNTKDIMENYSKLDLRIKYVRNSCNIGMAQNFNECLRLASAPYIKILCADDLLEQDYLEKTVAILDAYPHVVMVTCARLLITEKIQPIRILSYAKKFVILGGRKVINRCFFQENLIGEPTAVLFRKDVAGRGFDEKYKQFIDLEMWFHLLEQGDFANVPDTLCKFRQHERQGTKKNLKSRFLIEDMRYFYEDYGDKSYIERSFIRNQIRKFKIAKSFWIQKNNFIDHTLIKSKINEYFNIYVFYVLSWLNNVRYIVLRLFR